LKVINDRKELPLVPPAPTAGWHSLTVAPETDNVSYCCTVAVALWVCYCPQSSGQVTPEMCRLVCTPHRHTDRVAGFWKLSAHTTQHNSDYRNFEIEVEAVHSVVCVMDNINLLTPNCH
jgi:hypothetical protein